MSIRLATALLLLASPAAADPDTYAQVARGRALATAGDCIACHTVPGGIPFAGGLALETPFGTIMTPNLTPDLATGLGRWTADGFARALHEGRSPDGTRLYPAFPYTYYTRVTRADSDAIFAYLRALPPVSNAVNRSTLPWPFSIRTSMLAWNALYFTPGEVPPDPQRSTLFNRGAYLVEGLGHCGACHTTLSLLGATKDNRHLQGGQLQGWVAPSLTNDNRTGLGAWQVDDIVEYLQTGRNAQSAASGPMAEVVANSTSHMPKPDLRAIATYLKERGSAGTPAPAPAPAPVAASDPRMQAGAAIYGDTCAACHNQAGTGVAQLFPALAGSAVVQQDDPATLARIVVTGTRAVATDAAPTAPAMPSLGWRLSDTQVAAVLTYIRNSWGNTAPAVAASDVRVIRAKVVAP